MLDTINAGLDEVIAGKENCTRGRCLTIKVTGLNLPCSDYIYCTELRRKFCDCKNPVFLR